MKALSLLVRKLWPRLKFLFTHPTRTRTVGLWHSLPGHSSRLAKKSRSGSQGKVAVTWRSHKGLFPCKVSSLYWLMRPRTNLNAEVNQNVDRQTDGQTDGHNQSISRNRPTIMHVQCTCIHFFSTMIPLSPWYTLVPNTSFNRGPPFKKGNAVYILIYLYMLEYMRDSIMSGPSYIKLEPHYVDDYGQCSSFWCW